MVTLLDQVPYGITGTRALLFSRRPDEVTHTPWQAAKMVNP